MASAEKQRLDITEVLPFMPVIRDVASAVCLYKKKEVLSMRHQTHAVLIH